MQLLVKQGMIMDVAATGKHTSGSETSGSSGSS